MLTFNAKMFAFDLQILPLKVKLQIVAGILYVFSPLLAKTFKVYYFP